MSFIKDVEHLRIPLQDIISATNNFNEENFIGLGGFGKVYKGVLSQSEHSTVAIKRLDRRCGQGEREFVMEIAMLSSYKHENIVSLVGFCDESAEKILVYEHASNGSLDKFIASKDLTWIQRLQICIDAASGLKYLHHDAGPQHRVIHRDIKSSNVLLDENWKAKISDFGLSKLGPANVQFTFLITNACGTIGYVDPAYIKTGILTKESDVYSFGVVLFEVLSGRLSCIEEYDDERRFLVQLAKHHYEKETLDEIIDPNLWKQMNSASLSTFSTIAYRCLKKRREDRPTLSHVVEELVKALDYQQASHQLWKPQDQEANNTTSLPSSTSRSWTYDVYISFRGKDTRNTIVGSLYDALVRKGIYTFRDDALHRPEAYVAIEKSRFAIVIFSKNYASSLWCLEELVKIMKCKSGMNVLPIFYGVKPFEVHGHFGEVFSTLGRHGRVEVWREALKKAANLPGWVANGHDFRCIENIVETILLLVNPSEKDNPGGALIS